MTESDQAAAKHRADLLAAIDQRVEVLLSPAVAKLGGAIAGLQKGLDASKRPALMAKPGGSLAFRPPPPEESRLAVRIGTAWDPALKAQPERFPALIPLIGHGSVAILRDAASAGLCRTLLVDVASRLLASFPPGAVRLTMIDPVGLGQNFSALLSLNEYYRGLMAWHTEAGIEQVLTEKVAHISAIIQQNLTDKFADIQAYNRENPADRQALHLILVHDFPHGFTKKAAQHLMSIATNGARSGVYALLGIDAAAGQPQGMSVSSLTQAIFGLEVTQGGVNYLRPPFSRLKVQLDPPNDVFVRQVVEHLNAQAGQAQQKPTVSFESVHRDQAWRESSAKSLAFVGGADAGKPLLIEFGTGKGNHMLVAGMTGFGKTKFLHGAINSMAHRYSPDEVELYLIDFKDGVEFSVYRDLPHVRVLAIRSEREFAIGVLESLATRMEELSALMVDAGAQNLESLRRVHAKTRLPRITLIIDEFQMLFADNDGLAKEASRLLDQLVRQGRGFGIHIILATQTLQSVHLDAGTRSQFAFRVAMHLDEGDAAALFSNDNLEPMHLEAPGDAIFNDRSGIKGANRRFRVTYMEQDDIELRAKTLAIGFESTIRPLVYDGRSAGDLAANRTLVEGLAEQPEWASIYFGEPLRLAREHCAFRLVQQAGANLMICGQGDQGPVALFYAMVASARATIGRVDLRIINAQHVDSATWQAIDALAKKGARIIEPARIAPELGLLVQELERRAKLERSRDETRIVLAIAGAETRPFRVDNNRSQELEDLKRLVVDGPAVGIHIVLWGTSWPILQALESKLRFLTEFEVRVAFGGVQSERLIDARSLNLRPGVGYLHNTARGGEPSRFRTYATKDLTTLLT